MRITGFAVPVLASALGAVPVMAQESGRYSLHETPQGYVRLDTATGELTKCVQEKAGLVCGTRRPQEEASADGAARLERELAALEERVAALESRASGLQGESTSEEEFEKALGFMERFFRRFMGVVKDLESEFGPSEPEPDPAHKT